MHCNSKIPIGTELDFYFPESGLARELNGILHYQPIYGQDRLEQIKRNDEMKATLCKKAKIKLFVFDASEKVYQTNAGKENYWRIVKELVTSFQKRAGHTNVQVS